MPSSFLICSNIAYFERILVYWVAILLVYLTIIPRARMGYESIDHEAEGRMVY